MYSVATINPTKIVTVDYPPSSPFCTSRPNFEIDAVDDSAEVNTNNGEAIEGILNVFDNDTLKEIKRVSPKKGRIAFFDGSIKHTGSTPKTLRANINFNFIGKKL